MEMPRFVVLKSKFNHKNLSYIKDEGEIYRYLKCSGEEVVSPYSKYEVELAKSGNGLVNIRSCYNNKYWVRSKNSSWIVAGADEPEEDDTKWSCTLFEPIYVDGARTTVRFRHVQLKKYACFWGTGDVRDACLYAGSNSDTNVQNEFIIIDWETLVIFPKHHVVFKGHNNGYLGGRWAENRPYLQFADDDKGEPTARHQVFTSGDGSIRIKSEHFGKFWRRANNWIWADSVDTSNNNPDTLFLPIKVDNNVIALRSLGNNNFCKSHSWDGKTDCLNAALPTITALALLKVEELVLSRSIYNVQYRLTDARIYNESPLTLANGDAINNTEVANIMEITLKYTESKSKTWESSVSLKLGVTSSMKIGIPLIAEGQITISAEFNGGYQWGETDTLTEEKQIVYTVTVPPRTRVKVSYLATQGSCDVPFSYTQRDTYTDGTESITSMDDGVYTGINCFNFKYEATEEKL